MTTRERQSMLRASLLLLAAAAVRYVVAPGAAESPLGNHPSIADSLIEAGDSVAKEKARRSRPLEPGEKIDPNTASEEELDRLPGVGASKARRIVEDRKANGPFASPEDLARVSGIGAGSAGRLAPYLAFAKSSRSSQRPTGLAGDRRRSLAAEAGEGTGFGPRARSTGSSGVAPGQILDLNRASAAELQALPGIGPALAERIVAYRARQGRLAKPEELMEVSGIGPKTYARLAPLVTVRR